MASIDTKEISRTESENIGVEIIYPEFISGSLGKMKNYFVYILSSKTKVLYVGMTDILARRIYEHKLGIVEGFTKNYNVNKLVYYESQPDLQSAIKREKQLKNWHRQWKINLIEEKNKYWKDLYSKIADPTKILYSTK